MAVVGGLGVVALVIARKEKEKEGGNAFVQQKLSFNALGVKRRHEAEENKHIKK